MGVALKSKKKKKKKNPLGGERLPGHAFSVRSSAAFSRDFVYPCLHAVSAVQYLDGPDLPYQGNTSGSPLHAHIRMVT